MNSIRPVFLVFGKLLHVKGNREALKVIIYELGKLTKFYPMHIGKEDKCFFIQVMEYSSQDERNAMLGEFCEFDRSMIHEKYIKVVEEYEKNHAKRIIYNTLQQKKPAKECNLWSQKHLRQAAIL